MQLIGEEELGRSGNFGHFAPEINTTKEKERGKKGFDLPSSHSLFVPSFSSVKKFSSSVIKVRPFFFFLVLPLSFFLFE